MKNNKVDYEIFQIGESNNEEIRMREFQSFDGDVLDMDIYESVYKGTIPIGDKEIDKNMVSNILEDLFVEFNIRHPKDFKGRSLSVSDVVKLNDDYYHCQSIGWEKVKVNN